MRPGVVWLVAMIGWAGMPAGCSTGDRGSSPELVAPGVGEPFTAVRLSGDRPSLVWVFAVEQCLGCGLGDPARVVRGLQRSLGPGLETVAVAVGDRRDGDRRIVSGFLASQRITARVELHSREQHMREFGAAPLSIFYVVNRNSVVEAGVTTDSVETWQSARGQLNLAEFIARLAEQGVEQNEKGTGKM